MKNKTTVLKQDSTREALDPVSNENRIFGLATYIPFWISSMVAVQTFVVGQNFLPPKGTLNSTQGLTAAILAGVIIAIMFVINANPGVKYGIPFIVQARSSFGYIGARYVSLIRVLPAMFWYGIGSWIGASGLSYITEVFWGWSISFVYFILFMAFQTILAYFGIQTAKWFNTWLAIIIFTFFIYIDYKFLTVDEFVVTWSGAGSWGFPFIAAISAGVGTLLSAPVNIGDISRYLKKGIGNNVTGHMVGIFPFHSIIIITGILAAAATGIWDPIEALVSVINSPAIALVFVIFVIASQVTTNLTLNIIPPALQLTETFNIKWGLSTIIVGLLGIVTFPWVLFSSNVFNLFINYYSAFIGPLLGILIADYYLIRKRELDINNLYHGGRKYHWLGIGSIVISGIVGMVFLEISWIVALPLAVIIYVLGYQIIPSYKNELINLQQKNYTEEKLLEE